MRGSAGSLRAATETATWSGWLAVAIANAIRLASRAVNNSVAAGNVAGDALSWSKMAPLARSTSSRAAQPSSLPAARPTSPASHRPSEPMYGSSDATSTASPIPAKARRQPSARTWTVSTRVPSKSNRIAFGPGRSDRVRALSAMLNLAAQVGQYRQHAAVVIGSRQQLQLGEDAGDVSLNRFGGDEEALADGLVGAALCHQRQYFPLTFEGYARTYPARCALAGQ